MAATAAERPNSRQAGFSSGRIGYVVMGASAIDEAIVAILAAAPSTLNALSLRSASADVADDTAGAWMGEATYGTPGGAGP